MLRKANEEPADGGGCVLLPSLLLGALGLVGGAAHGSVGGGGLGMGWDAAKESIGYKTCVKDTFSWCKLVEKAGAPMY